MSTTLTPGKKRFLVSSAFVVRAYIILGALGFAIWCLLIAEDKYSLARVPNLPAPDDIPKTAVWANIFAIYFPIISGGMGYLFAEKKIAHAPLAPNGFGDAVLRDLVAVIVLTLVFVVPVWQYNQPGPINDVISILAWYQTVAFAVAGVAFYYYYRSVLKPFVATANANAERVHKVVKKGEEMSEREAAESAPVR
jgi:hypothetical protein